MVIGGYKKLLCCRNYLFDAFLFHYAPRNASVIKTLACSEHTNCFRNNKSSTVVQGFRALVKKSTS